MSWGCPHHRHPAAVQPRAAADGHGCRARRRGRRARPAAPPDTAGGSRAGAAAVLSAGSLLGRGEEPVGEVPAVAACSQRRVSLQLQ